MCGIWLYVAKNKSVTNDILYKAFMKLQPRGPDKSTFRMLTKYGISLGFHRLSIMDVSAKGDQPFVLDDDDRTIYAMCNGEIYNFKELAEKNKLSLESGSDCEVIPHIYQAHGMDILTKELRGEYALIIVDINKKTEEVTIHVARDASSARPLFYGYDDDGFCFSSELKGQVGIETKKKEFMVDQYKGGNYSTITLGSDGIWSELKKTQYYYYPDKFVHHDLTECKSLIRKVMIEAVRCRLSSDRPIGFLLSGGLDSSLICGIAYTILKPLSKPMYTFSIGFEGGTDQPNAEKVAKHIGSHIVTVDYGKTTVDEYNETMSKLTGGVHTHIMINEQDALSAISDVVKTIESHDLTSVRASVIQYLISKWISEFTNIKVLYCGDYSDEVFFSYLYSFNCPDEMTFHNEAVRLVDEIYKYDGIRCDRCVAGNGIELRLPFSDQNLIDLVFKIDPKLRMPTTFGMEKWLLREAFTDDNILPKEVLYRKKEALSDGCSSKEKSWFKTIQENVDAMYSEDDLEKAKLKYTHLTPYTKEGLHYRKLFEFHFGDNEEVAKVIPYYWLPKFCGNITDPSARVLNVYNGKTS